MDIKIIKTQTEYEAALELVETLLDKNPAKGSTDAHKLELLSLLVKDYEEKNFAFEAPTPVEAIKFRMEQEDLTPRDLIPYIGNRGKVSEVLSGKRTLSLSMIRALHSGLGIPLESLVAQDTDSKSINWEKFPLKEMKKRGWIDSVNKNAAELITSFLQPIRQQIAVPALLRQTPIRSAKEMDKYALFIWKARIIMQAKKMRNKTKYDPKILTDDLFKKLIHLSRENNSPLIAQNFLKEYGIILVAEKHFSKTYLDGAAIMTDEGPVIGLTLRYDRLDNFWFCLIHELAHLKLHLKDGTEIIYDDLESDPGDDPLEISADSFASEILIPTTEWNKSPASKLRASPAAAKMLAKKLSIDVSIAAGYMRHKFNNYRILNNLIGNKEVRKHFTYVKW